MARMILNARQIFDERRHSWQGPEVGLVPVCAWACQQRLSDLLGLLRRQLGFAASRSLAGQRRTPALLPRLLPSVSDLPGHAQAPGHFRRRRFLGKQFARLFAPLFHLRVISCLRHATTIQRIPTLVTLLREDQ